MLGSEFDQNHHNSINFRNKEALAVYIVHLSANVVSLWHNQTCIAYVYTVGSMSHHNGIATAAKGLLSFARHFNVSLRLRVAATNGILLQESQHLVY